jgi:BNR repeat-like domain
MRIRSWGVAVLAAGVLFAGSSAEASTPAGESQANLPQVAGQPTSDTTAVFPTNKQNEPTIALNPVDSRYLIAGSNDEQDQPACGPGPIRGVVPQSDCSFFDGVGTSGIYTSADGGMTWTNRGLLDAQASWHNAGVISDGDPVISYGPKPDGHGGFSYADGARAYYSTLATVAGARGFEYVVASYSDDNGLTWSSPVLAISKSSSAVFNDKNWLTVDRSPQSRYFGRVYLTWTQFRSNTGTGNGSEPVMVSVSADGGSTFAAPKQLSPAGNNGTGNGRQGSSSSVGPDGTVYVAFEQGPSQVVTISHDGGVSWTRPAVIGAVVDIADPIPGANFRTDSFPTIAADPRSASTTVYASWATRTAVGGRIVVAVSTNGGVSWSSPTTVSGAEGYAFFQGLAVAPTGRVDIAYQALVAVDPTKFGTGNAAIDSYAVSKASGGAWSAPVRLSAVSSDPAASAQNNLQRQFWGDYNTVVSDANGAWLVSTDSRGGKGCPAVDAYQKYLTDNHLVIQDDDEQPYTGKNAPDPSVKPAPPAVCPSQFGNTDIFVARIAP